MILSMEKLSVFGMLCDKEKVVNELMRKRLVQIRSPQTLNDYPQLKEITTSCTSNTFSNDQKLSRFGSALSAISPFLTKPGLFYKKPRVLLDNLEDDEMMLKASQLASEIEERVLEISKLRAENSKISFTKAALAPWVEFDLPLEQTETKFTKISLYIIPAKTDMAELEKMVEQSAAASFYNITSEDREHKYMAWVSHKADDGALWDILKDFGAMRPSLGQLSGTAEQNTISIEKRTAAIDAELQSCDDALKKLAKDVFPLRYAYDALTVRIQREKATTDFLATEKTFCFYGWVPETAKEKTIEVLEKNNCYFQFSECDEEDQPPILLQNGSIVAPYESITEMYSLPDYRGIDPDIFIAPFFFVFFGMMLSDAGYGLILLIGGLIYLKKADIPPGGGKLMKVITMCGLSTVIWGAIYGSWFGDIPTVIAKNFFNVDFKMPIFLDPLADPITILLISFGLGLLHIMVGIGIKAYLLIKRGKIVDAIFDVGLWYILFFGLIFILVGAGMLKSVGNVMLIVAAAGLLLTQGRDKKGIIGKLLGALLSLYFDVTGYFSDILSYSRILALGLATGVIGNVVNTMGGMMGGGILGAIVLIVVFVFGHALNLAINALGAYVHTSRLQYVEFFGKFYESGGKPFRPLMFSTKYITVLDKEEVV